MEWWKFLQYALIGIVVSLFMNYLNKAASKPLEVEEEGRYVLKMHKLYQWIGWLSIALGLVALISMVLLFDIEMAIIGVAMFLLFGVLGWLCLMSYNRHKVVFDEHQMTISSWQGKVLFFAWDEISDIKFNPISGYIKVYGPQGIGKIHMHMLGLKSFVHMMEQKTKWRAKELKIPII